MQLLSVNTARAIWWIHVRDMNPRGRHIDKIIEWFRSKYRFEKYPPSSVLEDESKGYVFISGSFRDLYVDFTVFNDGCVATTRSSTKDSEDFLTEALELSAKEFGLVYRPEMIKQKLYLSELEIKLERSLSTLNPKLEAFARRISDLQGNRRGPIEFKFSTINFTADPSIQLWRPANFQIERRLNQMEEDRFYSAAPLQTHHHLELLQQFEETILAD